MGDHIVVCPEQTDEPCSDPYYKPEDRAGLGTEGSEEAGRKYEDVDLESGGVDAILHTGLKRPVPDVPPPRKLDMGDHTVEYPEQEEEPSSDPYSNPAKTPKDENQDEKSFGL
uniref:Uncharacterized protein n=1 Tax=Branchiostoma floridae TaxID=7739 RepID=C3ZII9_BRAFL|eukprot:XP_002591703.1 hypothetical protein BRAFLDRAFT_80803 [Branchiostoma floridae]